MNLLYTILIGIAAGFLAGWILKGSGFGLVINLIIGIIGSFVGSWLFGVLNISFSSGVINHMIVSTIGAMVLLFVVGLIKGKR